MKKYANKKENIEFNLGYDAALKDMKEILQIIKKELGKLENGK